LWQKTDPRPLGGLRFADELVIEARHDPQDGAFARTIEAEHTDLGSVKEGERNTVDNRLALRCDLLEVLHGVYEVLRHGLSLPASIVRYSVPR